ncbi:Fanconi anemia core complex-associated protein 100 [Genypterus blacodes]|uniref:Fanconi anemia core complex-associated protein 100 n=1 Tax=Genypterus blacodes TaxID=154954 RepID=UPI003F7645D7
MEGRSSVESWGGFVFPAGPRTPKITLNSGTDVVLICSGSDEIYAINKKTRTLQVVFQFPGPVSDLIQSPDEALLYVASDSGVYCLNLPLLLFRAQSSLTDASPGPPEMKISPDCLTVEEEGVLSLLLVSPILLTLSHRGGLWTFTMYTTPPKESPRRSCEALRSFSLPVVHAAERYQNRGGGKPVLIQVKEVDDSAPSSPLEAQLGHFSLESALLTLLFGVEAVETQSTMILCGLPDGRLCNLALCPSGPWLTVLHNHQQPVVFVGASVVTRTHPGGAECLVVVGELGKVTLISVSDGAGGGLRFTEVCVPGPVVCGSVDQISLYCSTGSDLLQVDLKGWAVAQAAAHRGYASPALPNHISLNVCRIAALTPPTGFTADAVELLGLSHTGQLQMITVRSQGAGLPRILSAPRGQNITNCLAAVRATHDRTSALRSSIKSEHFLLKQLSQALRLSWLLSPLATGDDEREKPIRWHGMMSWSSLLGKDSINLRCVLQNFSPYVLEQGWTLTVAVCPSSCGTAGGAKDRLFSFPIRNLQPRQCLEVSLPLADVGDAGVFPMTVSGSLLFSLGFSQKSLLREDEAPSVPGLQSPYINMALSTLTVDWLDVLQWGHINATPQIQDAIETTRAFINSCRIGSTESEERDANGDTNPEREPYSASVWLCSELLCTTLKPPSPEASKSLCTVLLSWFLSGDVGSQGDKVGTQGDRRISVVHGRAPDGHMVTLSATEVNVGMAAVKVLVESRSLPAVCGLHRAMLSRTQTLLLKAPSVGGASLACESSLHETLQRVLRLDEVLQRVSRHDKALHGCEDSTELISSRRQAVQSRLKVYDELRQNPLLLI